MEDYYSQVKFGIKKGSYTYYYPYCKECTSKKSSDWQNANKEEFLKAKSEYQKIRRKQDLAFREYDRNKAKKRRVEGYNREYYEKNKEYFSNYQRERSAHKTHEISDSEWIGCKHYFNNACAYCGLPENDHYIIYAGELKKTDLHKEHVDHTGSNKLDNCVPSCQMCNSSKWAFELEKWYNGDNPRFDINRLNKIHNWLNEDYKIYINN